MPSMRLQGHSRTDGLFSDRRDCDRVESFESADIEVAVELSVKRRGIEE
jgi:hypothetical protein